ncbi:DUF3999 family protein [Saccharibacillus alkalitolerans]|uniref:DUF3999 domain-containing protein n=1 Tax=Saccharibacillus alkalitolerans TaxID=2705290 RepID=A0ABX0F6H2_9BACL|nr:DUF3999 family protein [Saccharibacillus alkalitolerans]NGZ76352.1 DUF3999 domain-containing protein [Saccharibacillus alkalitolerans]
MQRKKRNGSDNRNGVAKVARPSEAAASERRRSRAARTGLCALLLAGAIGAILPSGAEGPLGAASAASVSARPAEEEAQASGVWTFSKQIQTEQGARYQALMLDSDIYARAQEDLSDVRIADASGRFVPYYTDSGETGEPGEKRGYMLERIARVVGAEESVFDFRVVPSAETEEIRGTRLRFDLPDNSVLETVKIEGSYDGKRWEKAAEGELYSTGEGVFRNIIELDASETYGYYRLTVPKEAENVDFVDGILFDVGGSVVGSAFRRAKELPFNVEPDGQMSEIVLYNADKLKIDRIKVNASAADGSDRFSRLYYVSREKGSDIATQILSPDRLNRLEIAGKQVDDTEIRLAEPIRGEQPRVAIVNGGNPPLSIRSIEVGYRVDRLVFEDTGTGPYRLLYGAEGQSPPEYEISASRKEIEGTGPGQAELGPETAEQFVPPDLLEVSGRAEESEAMVGPGDSLRIFLYIVLGGTVLLLIVWWSRRRKGKRGTEET